MNEQGKEEIPPWMELDGDLEGVGDGGCYVEAAVRVQTAAPLSSQ